MLILRGVAGFGFIRHMWNLMQILCQTLSSICVCSLLLIAEESAASTRSLKNHQKSCCRQNLGDSTFFSLKNSLFELGEACPVGLSSAFLQTALQLQDLQGRVKPGRWDKTGNPGLFFLNEKHHVNIYSCVGRGMRLFNVALTPGHVVFSQTLFSY